MFNPDRANHLQGKNLRRLIEEVRKEFFARSAGEIDDDGDGQVNFLRVVIIEVYADLSTDARIAVLADVMRATEEIVFDRGAKDIYSRSDTLQAHITDFICEIVYQELMNDPAVMIESENREALLHLD